MKRKIAHYFYDDGVELVVWAERRDIAIREPDGQYPVDPSYKRRHPHPIEKGDADDYSYVTLGLYYGYGMSETGWSGDC